ncbi:unnamed protein product [Cuscuta epithymum]|uniref:Transcription repressor n=1 Tax=Cuscuta epithymum TaxID=186058 RepID=A0AAV0EX15_9ASTE|nr:unnamed protein product [Cuscuta epithymum]
MKFPFLSKSSVRWRPCPSCAMSGRVKTLSFREDKADVVKILNSAYRVEVDDDSCSIVFSDNDDRYRCPSTVMKAAAVSTGFPPEVFDGDDDGGGDEEMIKGLLRSERLFFNPEETTSSILAGGDYSDSSRNPTTEDPLEESVAMAMQSVDPFEDFKRSMEEMVEAHHHHSHGAGGGVNDDWAFLEELLVSYLRINGKSTHGYIVAAFVDLLVGLSLDEDTGGRGGGRGSCSSSTSFNYPEQCCLMSSTSFASRLSSISFSTTCLSTSSFSLVG